MDWFSKKMDWFLKKMKHNAEDHNKQINKSSSQVRDPSVKGDKLTAEGNDANFAVASSVDSTTFPSTSSGGLRRRDGKKVFDNLFDVQTARARKPKSAQVTVFDNLSLGLGAPPPPSEPASSDEAQSDETEIGTSNSVDETDASSSVGHSESITTRQTSARSAENAIVQIPEPEAQSNVDETVASSSDGHSEAVLDIELMFVICIFGLEVISTVFDQLSSVHKPLYSLLGMLFSYGAMFICIIELVYKAKKENVNWRCERVVLPWFYNSTSGLPFGTFNDIIGFVCALCQCIVTTINYTFKDNIIKTSVWPIIFTVGVLCSKVYKV